MTGDDSALLPRALEVHKMVAWSIRHCMTADHSMTHGDLALLMELWRCGPSGMGDLAKAMRVSKARVTAIAKNLEARRWAKRETVDSDERRKTLALTTAGLKQINSFMAELRGRLTTALADMPANNVERYVELGEQIAAAIDADVAVNGPIVLSAELPAVADGYVENIGDKEKEEKSGRSA